MTESARSAADGWPELPRRRLLLGVLGGAVSLLASGCSVSDPRVDGPTTRSVPRFTPSPSPSLTPSPTPTVAPPAEALRYEQDLAALARAIVAGPHRGKLSTVQRPLLTALATAHLQHATALASPDPTARPTSPVPGTSVQGAAPPGFARLTLAQSTALLRRNELAQANRVNRSALRARGFEALLFASIGVAAGSYASALGSTTALAVDVSVTPHRPMAQVSDVAAIQLMVRQLHAIIYGYQLALGQLSETSAAGARALTGLHSHRLLRDRLVAILVSRSAAVPAAAAAYVPSTDPTTARRSAKLIRQMETALQPFCGVWIAAAARPADRALALTTLQRTTLLAEQWGAPLTVWPGWQD